ncbi:MAG: porin [Bacteroidales bacterium]|nr:porin [Bacteroidales bacterium]
MKRKFRVIVGMLLLAIPLCVNAQVKIKTPGQDPNEAKNEKIEQEKPEKPKGGLEMPKISGFVQGMYQANLNNEGELGDNTFRMRRVRLSVDGKLSKTVSYKLQGDFVRSPMLVDAYVKYKPCNEFAIQVGQFKTPFTIESPINPVNLEIFDYGEAVQQLVGYKDVCGVGALGRDLGIMATGSLFPVENANGYQYSIVDYSIGVFNGNGANQLDNNNRKDLVGRLEVHPGLKALTLSGSYYYGQYYKDEENYGTRNRWAAGAQYNDGKLVLRGEYIGGKTGVAPTVIPEDLGYFNSNGYYAQAGYYFQAGEQKIMPVLRYEHFTKDASIEKGGTNWYTAGINYWPLKSVNCKLDYSLIQKESGTNSHRVVAMVSYKF